MIDVNLQPITPESKIPFEKVLLVSDGVNVTTATLRGTDENGYVFNLTVALNGHTKPITRMLFNPTHFAILNITFK